MAANTTPIYPAAPLAQGVHLTAANGARDASGPPTTLVAGGTNGARVDRVEVRAAATNHNNVVRFFVYDGTNTFLLHEVAVAQKAVGAHGTAQGVATVASAEWVRTDGEPVALLGPSDELRVGLEVADAVDVVAFGGTY